MKPLNLKFEMLNNEGGEVYITGDINLDFSDTIPTTKHPETLICYLA